MIDDDSKSNDNNNNNNNSSATANNTGSNNSNNSNNGNTTARFVRNRVANSQIVDNFKLTWTEEEIENFNDTVREIISNSNKNKSEDCYDGLIYIISAHGGEEDVVYDSFGEEYVLAFIFEKFKNHECKELRNKPKIFVIDTDRGDKEAKLMINSQYCAKEDAKTDNNINKDDKKDNDTRKKEDSNSNYDVEKKSESNFGKELENEEIWNQRFYCKEDHFRVIYSNAKGYKKIDSKIKKKEKGSHFLRWFTKVIGNDKEFFHQNNNLNRILEKTKSYMSRDASNEMNHQTQIVEDCNRMPYSIKFKQR